MQLQWREMRRLESRSASGVWDWIYQDYILEGKGTFALKFVIEICLLLGSRQQQKWDQCNNYSLPLSLSPSSPSLLSPLPLFSSLSPFLLSHSLFLTRFHSSSLRLITSYRTFFMFASSEAEADEWVQILDWKLVRELMYMVYMAWSILDLLASSFGSLAVCENCRQRVEA